VSDLKEKGTKAFLWDFLGKFVLNGMSFFVSLILARILSPSDFGLVAMVMAIIFIARFISDGGLSSALIQKRRLLPIHYSSVFYFNILISMLLTLILFLLSPYIANFYNDKAILPLVQVISFSIIINAFSTVQITKFQRELHYKLLTKISFLTVFSAGTVATLLALYGAGVWSLVAFELVQGVVYSILIWSASDWKPSRHFSLKALRQLWIFGFRMLLIGFLHRVFTQLDAMIIGKLFTPAILGFYSRAKALDQMVVNYSSGSLTAILFPLLSKIQNDLIRFQNIIIKSLGILSFIIFLLIGGLYLVSNELIILLFGGKWIQSVEYFKVLVLGSFGVPIRAFLNNILTSRGNSKAYLRLEIYTKSILSINFIILYLWGINTFLYGLVVISFINTFITVLFASREIKLPSLLFIRPILIQMLLSIIAVALTTSLTNDIEQLHIIMFLIKGSLFTCFYILLNYLLRTTSFSYFLEQIYPIIRKLLRMD